MVGVLEAEVERLRALCLEHDIDPDPVCAPEQSGPPTLEQAEYWRGWAELQNQTNEILADLEFMEGPASPVVRTSLPTAQWATIGGGRNRVDKL